MKIADITASIEDVAPALGLTSTQLKRRCKAMHAHSGFPLPLPKLDWRWSVEALATWAAAPGRKPDDARQAANDAGGLTEQEQRQREYFARRYGQQ